MIPPPGTRPVPARPLVIGWGIIVFAVLLTSAWFARATLIDAARAVAQRAVGIGELEWFDGRWRAVANGRRRTWGPEHASLTPEWRAVAPGLDTADLLLRRPPNPQTVPVFLARVDGAEWRFRVWGREDWAPGRVADLAAEAGLSLAVNASYFSDEEGPQGLIVSDGTRRRRQATRRAAHFLVPADGAPRIVNQRPPTPGVDATLAQGFQGFPGIMSGGETFAYMRVGGRGFDVGKVARRTAACVDRDGRVLLLATDTLTNGLSLAELATVLGGLGCVDAMGFDGGASTGMSLRVPGAEREIANVEPVPVILGITKAK